MIGNYYYTLHPSSHTQTKLIFAAAHIVLEKDVYEVSESVGKSLSNLALLVCAVQNMSHQTSISDIVNITFTTEDGSAVGMTTFMTNNMN